jgi:hypothetical protein
MTRERRYTVRWRGKALGHFTAGEIDEKIRARDLSAYHQIDTEAGSLSVRAWMDRRTNQSTLESGGEAKPARQNSHTERDTYPQLVALEPKQAVSAPKKSKAGWATLVAILVLACILYYQFQETREEARWANAREIWPAYIELKAQLGNDVGRHGRFAGNFRSLAQNDLPAELKSMILHRADLVEAVTALWSQINEEVQSARLQGAAGAVLLGALLGYSSPDNAWEAGVVAGQVGSAWSDGKAGEILERHKPAIDELNAAFNYLNEQEDRVTELLLPNPR